MGTKVGRKGCAAVQQAQKARDKSSWHALHVTELHTSHLFIYFARLSRLVHLLAVRIRIHPQYHICNLKCLQTCIWHYSAVPTFRHLLGWQMLDLKQEHSRILFACTRLNHRSREEELRSTPKRVFPLYCDWLSCTNVLHAILVAFLPDAGLTRLISSHWGFTH